MKEKIYARQVAPEYQISPLVYCDLDGDFMIAGNKRLSEMNIQKLEGIENLEGLYEQFHTRGGEFYDVFEQYVDFADVIEDYTGVKLPADFDSCWLEGFDRENAADIALFLTIKEGKEYDYRTIRGYSQGDWNILYYPITTADTTLRVIEMEYFNLGTEWVIHDEETEVHNADDIRGYNMYCCGWSTEEIKEEIALCVGVSPEDVVLFVCENCV